MSGLMRLIRLSFLASLVLLASAPIAGVLSAASQLLTGDPKTVLCYAASLLLTSLGLRIFK